MINKAQGTESSVSVRAKTHVERLRTEAKKLLRVERTDRDRAKKSVFGRVASVIAVP